MKPENSSELNQSMQSQFERIDFKKYNSYCIYIPTQENSLFIQTNGRKYSELMFATVLSVNICLIFDDKTTHPINIHSETDENCLLFNLNILNDYMTELCDIVSLLYVQYGIRVNITQVSLSHASTKVLNCYYLF